MKPNQTVVALSVVLLVALLMGIPAIDRFAYASSNASGTDTFTIVRGPTFCSSPGVPSCSTPFVEVTFRNNLNFTLTVIVFGIVHNMLGQTVAYTTTTIAPHGGQNRTAFLIVTNIPSGEYSMTAFAVTTNYIVISVSADVSFAL